MTTQRQQLNRQQQAIVNVQDAAERAWAEEADRIRRKWHRLPGSVRHVLLRAVELQEVADGDQPAEGGGGFGSMTTAESAVCLSAACSLVLSVRWSDGQELAILDADGHRVKVPLDNVR